MTKKMRYAAVNALTFARVPLIFGWLALAVVHELLPDPRSQAAVTLACAAGLMMFLSGLTDAWDGALARKWGVVSTLGKMADPLMDKVFYIIAFPALTWQIMHQSESEAHGLAMLGFTVLYMLRDTWVTFMRSIGAMYGANVAAMWLGKVRTALSFPGAGWIYGYCALHHLAPDSWQKPWLMSCYAVETLLALLTLWSLRSYTIAYMPYLMQALGRGGDNGKEAAQG